MCATEGDTWWWERYIDIDRYKVLHYLLVISYTTTATDESRIYEGINDLNLSCPAVSHNCNLTVRSSKYIVFDKKSIPIVA